MDLANRAARTRAEPADGPDASTTWQRTLEFPAHSVSGPSPGETRIGKYRSRSRPCIRSISTRFAPPILAPFATYTIERVTRTAIARVLTHDAIRTRG